MIYRFIEKLLSMASVARDRMEDGGAWVGGLLVKILYSRRIVCTRCGTVHGKLDPNHWYDINYPIKPFKLVTGACQTCEKHDPEAMPPLRVYPW